MCKERERKREWVRECVRRDSGSGVGREREGGEKKYVCVCVGGCVRRQVAVLHPASQRRDMGVFFWSPMRVSWPAEQPVEMLLPNIIICHKHVNAYYWSYHLHYVIRIFKTT